MTDQTPIDPGHAKVQRFLRIAGPVLLGLAGVCFLVTIGDIACTMMSHHHEPTLIWLWFLMIPMAFAGGVMTQVGYAGKFARYFSQEVTPPAVDTFNYAATGTKDSIRQIAGAIGEGLKGAVGTAAGSPVATAIRIRCYKCNHDNETDAKFCSKCGASLNKSVPCPNCQELNDPDAKFCDNCGRSITTDRQPS